MVIDLDLQKDSPMERYLRLVIDWVKQMVKLKERLMRTVIGSVKTKVRQMD